MNCSASEPSHRHSGEWSAQVWGGRLAIVFVRAEEAGGLCAKPDPNTLLGGVLPEPFWHASISFSYPRAQLPPRSVWQDTNILLHRPAILTQEV